MSENRLAIIWSSPDREIARTACFIYAHDACRNNWFDEVHLIIWGPSALMISHDLELQVELDVMKQDGVVVEACQRCTDMLRVTDELRELGIDVKPMGLALANMLQDGWKVLTF